MSKALRLITWLAPSIPLRFYKRIAATLAEALGRHVTLETDERRSGPSADRNNPFAAGRVDIGFLCAPTLVALSRDRHANVVSGELAPVFDDPRCGGHPIYFCDIVVRQDSAARDLESLRGARLGYNDPLSLSGWLGLKSHMEALGSPPRTYFSAVTQTGSHLLSLQALLDRRIDAASVDSNTRLLLAPERIRETRVITTLGPWPMQPVATRADLDPDLRRAALEALKQMGPWPDLRFLGFAAQPESALAPVPRPASAEVS